MLGHARHVGQRGRTLGAGDRDRRHGARPHLARHQRHEIEHGIDVSAKQIVQRRTRAAIVHDRHLDVGLGAQQLKREVK